jgi:PilZ domain
MSMTIQTSSGLATEMDSEPDQGRLFLGPSSGSERRRGLRIAQERPIKIYEPTACKYLPGYTQDISATGLRLTLPMSAPLRLGTVLAVHVGVGQGGQPLANRRDMMPAKVVWVDRSVDPAGRALCAGVEFIANIAAHLDAA